MKKYLEKSGKTEDEALAAALRELGLDRDDVIARLQAQGIQHLDEDPQSEQQKDQK